ncbi:Bug family tripartite tricarboxylate transporter substrate binding protein [Salipiger mangrovisoli]|uniref:Tripartite tricarboxylate transporter substrate binding protein n=1 Tax=Salipiger mangrovisoli TaxID=2865933 RepID=A0ABR9X9F0_9RHOB|nr:tripartite tricarboxylate transporter substrate binding protein [Salipiger mangrovisoli]MBE9640143.1 tripartite tricarboxylate transporter substrate binding protein [Salipiger mangrovisoli]
MTRLMTAAALGLVFATAGAATAQDWPKRAVDMVVAYGAGGGTDTIARQLAEPMSASLGQPVVVKNLAGAGGTIGAAAVAGAEPDGYTLYMMAAGHSVAAAMYKELPYDPAEDFVGVSGIATMPLVLITRPESEIDSVAKLVEMAKADPGGLTIASVGVGSTQHLTAALIASELGIELLEIPYAKTPEGLAAVMSGEVDMMVEVASTVIGQIGSGDLRGIGVTSPEPHPAIPEVGSFTEAGYDLDVSTWYGVAAPAGTDAAILSAASAAVAEATRSDAFAKSLEEGGFILAPSSPEAFTQTFRDAVGVWKAVREEAGIAQN